MGNKDFSAKDFRKRMVPIFKKFYKKEHGKELSEEDAEMIVKSIEKIDDLVMAYASEEAGGVEKIEVKHIKNAWGRVKKEFGI